MITMVNLAHAVQERKRVHNKSRRSGVWSVEMQIELDTSVAQQRELIAHALLKDAAKVLVAEL